MHYSPRQEATPQPPASSRAPTSPLPAILRPHSLLTGTLRTPNFPHSRPTGSNWLQLHGPRTRAYHLMPQYTLVVRATFPYPDPLARHNSFAGSSRWGVVHLDRREESRRGTTRLCVGLRPSRGVIAGLVEVSHSDGLRVLRPFCLVNRRNGLPGAPPGAWPLAVRPCRQAPTVVLRALRPSLPIPRCPSCCFYYDPSSAPPTSPNVRLIARVLTCIRDTIPLDALLADALNRRCGVGAHAATGWLVAR